MTEPIKPEDAARWVDEVANERAAADDKINEAHTLLLRAVALVESADRNLEQANEMHALVAMFVDEQQTSTRPRKAE